MSTEKPSTDRMSETPRKFPLTPLWDSATCFYCTDKSAPERKLYSIQFNHDEEDNWIHLDCLKRAIAEIEAASLPEKPAAQPDTSAAPAILDVSVEGGKYRVIMAAGGRFHALRHGQEWRDLTGDKLIFALAHELAERRASTPAPQSSNSATGEDFVKSCEAQGAKLVPAPPAEGPTSKELAPTHYHRHPDDTFSVCNCRTIVEHIQQRDREWGVALCEIDVAARAESSGENPHGPISVESAAPGERAAPSSPTAPAPCGEVVTHLIAGASWYPCALPKGHEGGHRAAGSCVAHGDYLGEVGAPPQCPKWPACVKEIMAKQYPTVPAAPAPTEKICEDCAWHGCAKQGKGEGERWLNQSTSHARF